MANGMNRMVFVQALYRITALYSSMDCDAGKVDRGQFMRSSRL